MATQGLPRTDAIKSLLICTGTEMTTDLSVRSQLTRQYMQFAAFLAQQSARLEQERRKDECRRYVAAAVILSFASLEAAINEVYCDARDGLSGPFQKLPPFVPGLLNEFWPVLERQRASTLTKYQVALELARKTRFELGQPPLQPVLDVKELRNALLHFKPQWDTDEHEHHDHAYLERRLRSKFTLSPLYGPGDAFFPKQCLSYGCARWAIESLTDFIEKFASRMDLVEKFRDFEFDLDVGDG
jgi:hypothetical protein